MKDFVIHYILCLFAGIGIAFVGLLTAIQLHDVWHLINFSIDIYTVAGIGLAIGIFIAIVYATPYVKEEHKQYKRKMNQKLK